MQISLDFDLGTMQDEDTIEAEKPGNCGRTKVFLRLRKKNIKYRDLRSFCNGKEGFFCPPQKKYCDSGIRFYITSKIKGEGPKESRWECGGSDCVILWNNICVSVETVCVCYLKMIQNGVTGSLSNLWSRDLKLNSYNVCVCKYINSPRDRCTKIALQVCVCDKERKQKETLCPLARKKEEKRWNRYLGHKTGPYSPSNKNWRILPFSSLLIFQMVRDFDNITSKYFQQKNFKEHFISV